MKEKEKFFKIISVRNISVSYFELYVIVDSEVHIAGFRLYHAILELLYYLLWNVLVDWGSFLEILVFIPWRDFLFGMIYNLYFLEKIYIDQFISWQYHII